LPIPSEIRATLKQRLAETNVTLADLSRVCGLSVPTISNFIAGRFQPGLQELQQMHQTLSRMERLAAACHPVRVDFSDAQLVSTLLSKLDEGRLWITVSDHPLPEQKQELSGGLLALAGM
jgi:transcriptional regulator with XRE-family HTH domain